jgi:hypothetical protein
MKQANFFRFLVPAIFFNLFLVQTPVFAAPRTLSTTITSNTGTTYHCKQAVYSALKKSGITNVRTEGNLIIAYQPNIGDTLIFVQCVPLPRAGLCNKEAVTAAFFVAGVTNDADKVYNTVLNNYRNPKVTIIDGC